MSAEITLSLYGFLMALMIYGAVWPEKLKQTMDLVWDLNNLKITGIVFLVASIIILYLVLPGVAAIQAAAIVFGSVLLYVAFMCLMYPKAISIAAEEISKKSNRFIRNVCIVVAIFGLARLVLIFV